MKRAVILLLLSLVLPAAAALAQTGKIAGQVRDAMTGEALPGVNVVIEGTTTGATTDEEGYYAILNVSPGTYSLRASFVGFAPLVVADVRVNIDLTTEIDFELQEEAVGLDELVVTAEAPIIQRDISGTQRNIDAEEIQSGRYQDIEDVVAAQVGVNVTSAYNDRPGIRGSSFEEAQFMVDGVAQGDPLTNRPHFRVNLDAIEEVKMQTGGFSAEFGNVRSGVINVVTKEGSETYSGSINLQYSPPGLKHQGPMVYGFDSPIVVPFVDPAAGAWTGVDAQGNKNRFFAGWYAVAQDRGKAGPHFAGRNAPQDVVEQRAQELYARWLWRHRSQEAVRELKRLAQEGVVEFAPGIDPDEQVYQQYGVLPDYRVSATFGGPLPFLNAVKFFVAYDQESMEYAIRGPLPTYDDRQVRGKLTTKLSRNVKLNLHGFYSRQTGSGGGNIGPMFTGFISKNPFDINGQSNKLWYPHCATPGGQTRQVYGATLTHTLSANTFYDVRFSHHRTDYELLQQMRDTAPLPGTGRTELLEGLIGTEAEAEAKAAAGEEGWANWRDWARIKIGDYWYDEGPAGHGPVNWRDVTGEYRMSSCQVQFNDTYSRSYDLNTSLTSQVNRHHQVKAGLQVRYDVVEGLFQGINTSVNGGTTDQVRARPWTYAVFAQDKIEFSGFVANLGLRLDGVSHSRFPVLNGGPEDPDSPYSKALLAGNADSLEHRIPQERVTHLRLSPRLGISHPITTVAKIFFNYGHFYQWPETHIAYRMERNTVQGGRITQYGNPLVQPPRTIAYEVGYEHNLFNRMSLRMTGYYKDINNELAAVSYYPLGQRAYRIRDNQRFRDVRGLEAFLELRRGTIPYLSGWVSFNYMVESGGRFGYDRFYEDPTQQPRQVSTEVSSPDVRPLIKANATFSLPDAFGPRLGATPLLGGLNVNLLYTWHRGEVFTWNPEQLPLVEDNVRWRPYQRWDLRLSKSLLQAGRFDAVFYLDVTNLLNSRNMTRYNGGQDVTTDRNWAWDDHKWFKNQFTNYMHSLDLEVQPDGSVKGKDRPGDYPKNGKREYIDMPDFTPWTFLEARDIFFGVKLYF